MEEYQMGCSPHEKWTLERMIFKKSTENLG